MEGDLIKTYPILQPLAWIYGGVMTVRNWLFDTGVLKERTFPLPVISVGNITVGGCGKTPHVEYLIELLREQFQVAVLSRGYKRKSKGYVLANESSTVYDLGDEPMQMHLKYPEIYVAVDKNRCEGIENLLSNPATENVEAILLDDAYQHRYVKPGLNILLVDYHRLITYDRVLPAGRLREPKSQSKRADMVIVTKCPTNLTPMEYRGLSRNLNLLPYQKLYFTSIVYKPLIKLFSGETRELTSIKPNEHIMLIAGIASPQQIVGDLKQYCYNITTIPFTDHHQFNGNDIDRINREFAALPTPRLIVTTEKDAMRLKDLDGFSQEVRDAIHVLPIKIQINLDKEENFNEKIISYVRKSSRKSVLWKASFEQK